MFSWSISDQEQTKWIDDTPLSQTLTTYEEYEKFSIFNN
jgi:hypothetical protein